MLMTRKSVKINFKYDVGDVVIHKLNNFNMLVLSRSYHDGSSGEGEIKYVCRQGDEDMLECEPGEYGEFELLAEDEVPDKDLADGEIGV